MAPIFKRDCGLVLFDVGSSKKEELLDGLIQFSTFKWFMNSKNLYRLILVNSEQTCNEKNYPNIFTTEIEDFDPKAVTKIIENAKVAKSNWLDALLLAIYHLEEAVGMNGLITLQLIFFTTLDVIYTPVLDVSNIQTIVSKLKEHNMFLYIIGPNIELPFAITSPGLVKKCMKEIQVDQKNQNLVVAKRIVNEGPNCLLCNTKIGLHLLISFKNSHGSQPWRKPFTIGHKLSIQSTTTKIYRKDISLKMYSPVQRNFVKTLAENRDVIVEDSEIIRGIVRHGTCLKIDEEMFRIETESCFEIMGFTHKKFVSETYLRGEDTFYVLPNEIFNDSFQIFTHLVNILAESNKYAICKRVYSTNNKPRYFALIPNLDFDPKCFTMTGISYVDYLTPHNLVIDNKESKTGISIGPTMMIEFHQQKLIKATAEKYLQKKINFNGMDEYLSAPTNKFLETLKRSWPARNLEPPSKH
ncbi:uncharacterized protein LOC130443338 [Diorhabda sublineata]|uniref:uncharacterized protein LOC130443338 n=1 Tax=Diorhabda sublineata TaxID=1163346 RepID=UPI0024E0F5E8|nr:uncharacterized protein LOC130443338 [Diorhabda sublineata]